MDVFFGNYLLQSVRQSVHLSDFPFVCLSFHLSVFWFHIPQWLFTMGERILHHFPCSMSKIDFTSLLLITHKRLGVTFSCLVLIVLHEQGFGVMIPFCEINFEKNIIEPTISHMIYKYLKLFTFFSKTTSNHLLSIWHL